MEQEQDSPILYSPLRRAGYGLAIAIHAIFIATALLGTIVLLVILLLKS